MSGGSYEYLCWKQADQLLTDTSELERMADDLAKLGYADDVARETMDLLLDIRAARNRIEAQAERLSDVWKAREWWMSCDTSEDTFKQALEAHRAK